MELTLTRTLVSWCRIGCLGVLLLSHAALAGEPPAKVLFGAVNTPARGSAAAIGGYAKGCLQGGQALTSDGPGWQAMRLSRNRLWGHPVLIEYIHKLADAMQRQGYGGLLVGDLSQPRGGPMVGGHRSHQTGLDVDLWLQPAPARVLTRQERETLSAQSLLKPHSRELDESRFNAMTVAYLRTVASFPEVDRVFVHPAIKQGLCRAAGNARAWLHKIRPWWGHQDHLHVRLSCPDAAVCDAQEPLPTGDGCGEDLAWWFTDEPWLPSTKPPAPDLRLDDLPAACAGVLHSS